MGRALSACQDFGYVGAISPSSHRSGEEGIDELWGEPLKAFAFPIEEFYRGRYVKIAQSMRDIDRIRDELSAALDDTAMFAGIAPLVRDFARAARVKCETLRTDPAIFDVWTSFVVSGELLSKFEPRLSTDPSDAQRERATRGRQLIAQSKELIESITRARVPMPRSTRELIDRLRAYHGTRGIASRPNALS